MNATLSDEAKAGWLVGLTDGEGCFMLYETSVTLPNGKAYSSYRANFSILLRRDDVRVLKAVMEILGCGSVTHGSRGSADGRRKPAARYGVGGIPDLIARVVPFFDSHPLQSKKARDYRVWRKGVMLMWQVYGRRVSRKPGQFSGWAGKWRPEEIDEFKALNRELSQTRRYIHVESPPEITSDHSVIVIPEALAADYREWRVSVDGLARALKCGTTGIKGALRRQEIRRDQGLKPPTKTALMYAAYKSGKKIREVAAIFRASMYRVTNAIERSRKRDSDPHYRLHREKRNAAKLGLM